MSQEDHDLLIEIRTITRLNNDNFVKHCEDDARIQGTLESSISALHRRVDMLLVSGVLGIVVIVLTWLMKLGGNPS